MKQQPKKYDITQCALYKCSNKRRLEKILRLDDGELKKINDMIRYHSFHIDKKDSKEKRQIMAPDYELKKTQRRILCLLQRVIRPEWLISGEKGKSYIDNGKAHLLSRYAFTMESAESPKYITQYLCINEGQIVFYYLLFFFTKTKEEHNEIQLLLRRAGGDVFILPRAPNSFHRT